MSQATQASRSLELMINAVGELPASPAVVNLVMGMTANLNTDIRQLAKALSADQSMTAKVLKLSNSSFYGRSKAVATLDEAILILGFFTLRSLVIATATHSLFKDRNPQGMQKELWEHSLATAMAARLLATKALKSSIEEAYIAGLMHDLGKLIFLQKSPTEYLSVIERVKHETVTFTECEREAFGFDHAELGQALLQKWSFPQDLIDAVRDHHNPARALIANGEAPLAHIVALANMLAKRIGIGCCEKNKAHPAESPSAALLGFDTATLDQMVVALARVFAEEKGLFA